MSSCCNGKCGCGSGCSCGSGCRGYTPPFILNYFTTFFEVWIISAAPQYFRVPVFFYVFCSYFLPKFNLIFCSILIPTLEVFMWICGCERNGMLLRDHIEVFHVNLWVWEKWNAFKRSYRSFSCEFVGVREMECF